jgi:hypothetical protein
MSLLSTKARSTTRITTPVSLFSPCAIGHRLTHRNLDSPSPMLIIGETLTADHSAI